MLLWELSDCNFCEDGVKLILTGCFAVKVKVGVAILLPCAVILYLRLGMLSLPNKICWRRCCSKLATITTNLLNTAINLTHLNHFGEKVTTWLGALYVVSRLTPDKKVKCEKKLYPHFKDWCHTFSHNPETINK